MTVVIHGITKTLETTGPEMAVILDLHPEIQKMPETIGIREARGIIHDTDVTTEEIPDEVIQENTGVESVKFFMRFSLNSPEAKDINLLKLIPEQTLVSFR